MAKGKECRHKNAILLYTDLSVVFRLSFPAFVELLEDYIELGRGGGIRVCPGYATVYLYLLCRKPSSYL